MPAALARDIRASVPGTWAQTELGKVHQLYNTAALDRQPLCWCTAFIPGVEHFGPIAELVAKRGVPVLTLDLFGRGLSDWLKPEPLQWRYLRRVCGRFAACLKLDNAQVDILGFSMGGQIIQHVAVAHPHLMNA